MFNSIPGPYPLDANSIPYSPPKVSAHITTCPARDKIPLPSTQFRTTADLTSRRKSMLLERKTGALLKDTVCHAKEDEWTKPGPSGKFLRGLSRAGKSLSICGLQGLRLACNRDKRFVLQAREDETLHRSHCGRAGGESRAMQVTEPTERDGGRIGEMRGNFWG